jgi:hypothetical protein
MFHALQRSGAIRQAPGETWSAEGRHDFAYNCRFLRSGQIMKVQYSSVAALPEMFVFAESLLSAQSFRHKQQ